MKAKVKKDPTRWLLQKMERAWELGRLRGDRDKFISGCGFERKHLKYSFPKLWAELGPDRVIRRLWPLVGEPLRILESQPPKVSIEIDLSFPKYVLRSEFEIVLANKPQHSKGKWEHFNKCRRAYEMIEGKSIREVAKILHPTMKIQSATRTVRRDIKKFFKMIEMKRGRMK